ncbi:MAG TPA: glycosyltransferase family 39 protein [Burkholderiales bacterium]|nr:glycosyltransferase family 39 protein [Burkholderiales bacterium]
MAEVNTMTPLPRAPVLFALLLLAYLLPGLVGHDPWKTADATGIGIVHQMLEHGQWIVPYLAGEPYLKDGPFHYWIAALTAKLFGLVLAPHDGARLATGVMMAAVVAFVHLAGRELYGRTEGMGAVLALLGCLGLLAHAHETLGEISMLAGQALAWYGIALAPRKPQRAGWLLGAGLVVAVLSKGVPGVVAPMTVALAAPLASSTWLRREYLVNLIQALLMILVLCGGWLALAESRSSGLALAWWHANATQFAAPPSPAVLGYWGQTLAWALWPAWPLALWTLWEGRRRTIEPGTRVLIAAVAVTFAVLLFLSDPREVYALPLLLPLALLAGAGVPSLRRGAANALAWFGAMSAGLLGALMWLGWFAMMTGFPPTIARNFAKLEPGHVPQFSWAVFTVALAFTLAWLWLILRGERSVFRSVTFWAAGITLLWGLAMTLILSWIDYGKSYRTVAQALRKNIPADTRCIESRGLGEAQRAVFDYHAEVVTERLERNAEGRCALLLIQAREGESDNIGPGWKFLWEGRRPRDRERFRLYQRQS